MKRLAFWTLSFFSLLAFAGCDKASASDCEKFADKLIELEVAAEVEAGHPQELVESIAGDKRDGLVKQCTEELDAKQVTCAIGAESLDAAKECG